MTQLDYFGALPAFLVALLKRNPLCSYQSGVLVCACCDGVPHNQKELLATAP